LQAFSRVSRNRKPGGAMAEKKQSKIRYDDFVANVQPDPAKPESTVMLSGFVGRGAEGHVRVYTDPSLGTWYDVPEDDVVHNMPIADSKLGGSYVWARASAQIKPGSSAGGAGTGGPQAAAAAAPAAAPPAVPVTPQPTPATHCFICPSPTQNCTPATICTLHGHCPPQPTPATLCLICPPHQTLATVCTQLCTHPQGGCLPPIHTQPVACGILPPSFGCAQAAPQAHALAAAAVQPTPTVQTRCFDCPPHQTLATVCTQLCTHPQGGCLPPIHTQFVVCGVLPPSLGCTQPPGCPPHTVHNTLCICPTPSAVNQCGPAHPTLATVCTLPPGCPPPGGGHTVHPTLCICPTPGAQTLATLCTHPGHCPTQWFVCPPGRTGVFTPFGG
jgi:hypothetical protein